MWLLIHAGIIHVSKRGPKADIVQLSIHRMTTLLNPLELKTAGLNVALKKSCYSLFITSHFDYMIVEEATVTAKVVSHKKWFQI